jgi:hypothetical protein
MSLLFNVFTVDAKLLVNNGYTPSQAPLSAIHTALSVKYVGDVSARTETVERTDNELMMRSTLMHSTAGFVSFLKFMVYSVFLKLGVFNFFSLPEFCYPLVS